MLTRGYSGMPEKMPRQMLLGLIFTLHKELSLGA